MDNRSIMHLRRLLCTVAVALLCAVMATASHADQIVRFQLYNVHLSDGSAATGTFDYNFTQDSMVDISIVAAGGIFTNSATSSTDGDTTAISGSYDTTLTSDNLLLTYTSALDPVKGASFSTDPSLSNLIVDTTVGPGGGSVITLTIVSGSVIPVSQLPNTSALLTGTHGLNGWFHSAVNVTLNAKAGYNPVKATYYSLDGGTAKTYTGQFAVTGEGSHLLTFWSVDITGLTENLESANVNIDMTPPVTAATHYGENVQITATDNASGVMATFYTVNGGPVQKYSTNFYAPVGHDTLVFWSEDNSGEVEATHQLSFVTGDTEPPTAPVNPHTVRTVGLNAVISWGASHDNVAVAYYQVFYYYARSGRGGGGGWRPLVRSTSTTVTVYKYYTIGVCAVDTSGNASPIVIAH